MSKNYLWIFCLLFLLVNFQTKASTLRNNFVDNINSGIKLAEKILGISSTVADLVAQTFSENQETKKATATARQDVITIGDSSDSALDQNMISGMLKLLGFDGAKIGAAAVNGIIFIAQMVRLGVNSLMNFTFASMKDWMRIGNYIGDRMKNDSSTYVDIPFPDFNPKLNISSKLGF